jgi:hypothetical protein
MASREDLQKRRVWERRFQRFRSCGLTVAGFCQQERVSTQAFYYWAKRIASVSVKTSLSNAQDVSCRKRSSAECPPATPGTASAGLVRFVCPAAVEVSVPADCLDAIRCLAECFQQAGRERSAAFQEVVVSS